MFLWSFWYIICIFMILFELDMIYPSFINFLEFELKGLILVPSQSLPTETDRWVLTMSAATLAVDWSNQLTGPGPHRRRAGKRRRWRYGASPDTLLSLFELG
jgi:hypothetical protein